MTGPYATTFFTTAPTDTAPTPGVAYTDVSVFGSNQATPDSGGVAAPFGFVEVYVYTVDESGQPVLISDTFGGTFSNVTFTTDKKLGTASLSATFDQLKQITPGNLGGEPVSGGTVSVSWTATGPASHYTDVSKTLMPHQGIYLWHERDLFRAASATGTVLGTAYAQSVPYRTEIGKVFQSERLVLH
ncbi:MAG TPA: hypothetical protein VFH66_01220 [Mycobacteriales bacterium]|nr:hypothetical protein [Mycobacteriales bacterium]